MNTRYIATGIVASIALIVSACSTTPDSSNTDLAYTIQKASFVAGSPGLDIGSNSKLSSIKSTDIVEKYIPKRQSRDSDYSARRVANTAPRDSLAPRGKLFPNHDYSRYPLPTIGQTASTVLNDYGQPARRQQGANGTDMWDYGSFRVIFHNNTVSHAAMW